MRVVPLAQAFDAERCGGKAAGLARAIAHGLPVPPGFVVPVEAAGDAAALDAAVGEAARALGAARLAVRSSATIEDRPGASAAGLFRSRIGVAPAEAAAAARECVASRAAPHVAAYLAHHAIAPARVGMAVIVQAAIAGVRGFAASGAPPRVEAWSGWSPDPEPAAIDPALLARAEAAAGGPAAIEWVRDEAGRTWVVQLRAAPAPPPADFPIAFASEEDARAQWRHDREHNPDPLSPAHEGLIAALGGALRVFNGYLYAAEGAAGEAAIPPEDLVRAWRETIAPEVERALAPLEARANTDPRARLDEAIALLRRVGPRYGAAQAAVGATRARLIELARRHVAAEDAEAILGLLAGIPTCTVERDQELWRLGRAALGVEGLGAYLADPAGPAPASEAMADWFTELRAFLDRYGALAPAWDVAAPTHGEDPRPIFPAMLALAGADASPEERRAHAAAHAAGRRAALRARLREAERAELDVSLSLAEANLAVGEEDDLLFARVLRAVRRPLLAIGQALARDGRLDAAADVFWLPLELAQAPAPAGAPSSPGSLRASATAARDEHARRRAIVPPTHVRGGARRFAPPSGAVLRGFGIGGRARGPARVVRDLAAAPADVRGAVLVVPAVLPQMTFLLAQAAAIVADHGGLLDHGALQAREYGLAAVVGARDATRVLRDGEELIVDGVAGAVYRVG